MSHGVDEAAARIRIEPDLERALAGTTHAVGFTGKLVRHRRVEPFSAVRAELAGRIADSNECVALVFGAEQNGLLAEEAARCQRLAFFETSEEHTSLNLSMAVTVALYALFEPGVEPERRARFNPLEADARDFLIENVARTLGDAALNDSARADIDASVRRLARRSSLAPDHAGSGQHPDAARPRARWWRWGSARLTGSEPFPSAERLPVRLSRLRTSRSRRALASVGGSV
jgi:tRNA C32,U32 (ribose-2'-O)-methylase TrmJ